MTIENIKKVNREVKTFTFPKPSLKRDFQKEVQLMEAANFFGEYHNYRRTGSKRSHKLTSGYKGCYGIGLNHKYRTVVKPKPDITDSESGLNRTKCKIIEICNDYH